MGVLFGVIAETTIAGVLVVTERLAFPAEDSWPVMTLARKRRTRGAVRYFFIRDFLFRVANSAKVQKLNLTFR
jgi:hypothetical protein